MPARSAESSRKPSHPDVHDIRSLTSTGVITLPQSSVRKTPKLEEESDPTS